MNDTVNDTLTAAQGMPVLDTTGQTTTYDSYIGASVLTGLQHTMSEDPGEMAFLVTTQIMELWFRVIGHEWRAARDALREDRLPEALDALRRSLLQHQALNDSWRPIAALTPTQFNAFRAFFGTASGFQSPSYRHLEFLLGEKSASLLVPFRSTPDAHAELEAALGEPGLYDETLHYLYRQGMPVPEHVLERDVTQPYAADAKIDAVWGQIYAGDPDSPLALLAETLTDVAELVIRWRQDHLLATRRAMGSKTGSAGSSGVAWLEKRTVRPVFPELWSARSHV